MPDTAAAVAVAEQMAAAPLQQLVAALVASVAGVEAVLPRPASARPVEQPSTVGLLQSVSQMS